MKHYDIDGYTLLEVVRKDGRVICILMDTEDFDKLQGSSVYVNISNSRVEYARTKVNGNKIYLHRLILNASAGLEVDHINGNTLDNRKHNLRLVTRASNLQNLKNINKANTSGARGVSWCKLRNKWRTSLCVDGTKYYLGYYANKEGAIEAVSLARKRLMPFSEMDKE